MWHANSDRKLVIQGKFKELFLEGVYSSLNVWFKEGDRALLDGRHISTNDHPSKPYRNFSNEEKLYALAEVTRCLTTKCRPPELLQWNESAVYAVFESINNLVRYEIETREEYEYMALEGEIGPFDPHERRRLVSEAQREVMDSSHQDHIDPECDDPREWKRLILGRLSKTILWDDDFIERDFGNVPDKSPETAKIFKRLMGVADNYYSEPMPLVTEKMLGNAKRFLMKTFGRILSS